MSAPTRPDFASVMAELREYQARYRGDGGKLSPLGHDAHRDQQLSSLQMRLSGIPPRYEDAEPTNPDVRAWAEQLAAGGREGLLLLGPTGVGKTWQVFGALRWLAYAEWKGNRVVGSWPALVAQVRAEIGDRNLDADSFNPSRRLEDRMRTCSLLFLDDLGADRPTEWAAELLYLTVDHRWQYDLPVVVASNLTAGQLREAIGDRLTSRLAGMCRQVSLTGDDRRRRR